MEKAKFVIFYVGILSVALAVGNTFSKAMEDVKVINPKPGVECAVVSRNFNTSIDCWKE